MTLLSLGPLQQEVQKHRHRGLRSWAAETQLPWINTSALVAQKVKSLPAVWETRVRSLSRKDPLEKEMAPHSSNSCLGSPMGRRVRHDSVQFSSVTQLCPIFAAP